MEIEGERKYYCITSFFQCLICSENVDGQIVDTVFHKVCRRELVAGHSIRKWVSLSMDEVEQCLHILSFSGIEVYLPPSLAGDNLSEALIVLFCGP